MENLVSKCAFLFKCKLRRYAADEEKGTKFEALKKKPVERDWYWQDGADRAIQMPLEEVISMDVVVDWAGDSEKEKMWLCMPVPFAPKPSPEGNTRE